MSYKSDTTQNLYESPADTPCVFWFGTPKQQIAAGRVWMEFECDQVKYASSNSVCSIGEGVVAFQNCLQ